MLRIDVDEAAEEKSYNLDGGFFVKSNIAITISANDSHTILCFSTLPLHTVLHACAANTAPWGPAWRVCVRVHFRVPFVTPS